MKKVYWVGALVFLGIALVVLYLPTLRWLWYEWFKPEVRFYSHGPLVLLISSLLLLRKRAVFAYAKPWWKGAPVVLLGLGLGIVAQIQHLPALSAYSLILLVIGVMLLLCGRGVTRQLLFPLLFLVLAVPFPFTNQLAGFLARIVATGSVALAKASGLDIGGAGTWVVIGGYSYSIEPLCSSLNIILALFTLVLPLLYLRNCSRLNSALLLLGTPAVALVFKIILITSIFWMTEKAGQEAALGAYHGWAGMLAFWLSLLAILLPLLLLARRERRRALRTHGAFLAPARRQTTRATTAASTIATGTMIKTKDGPFSSFSSVGDGGTGHGICTPTPMSILRSATDETSSL